VTDTDLTPAQVKARQRVREASDRLAQARVELKATLETIDAQHDQTLAELARQRAEFEAHNARITALAESFVSPERRRQNQEYAKYVAARDWRRRQAEVGRCRCNSMWHYHPTPTWVQVIQWGFVVYLVVFSLADHFLS
jgi:hypothetical protein